jgi:pSer/pThr/pTyr-binding forkhead associated (FHA) protein
MPSIEVISGSLEGETRTFDNEILIGSAEDAGLTIRDNGISRNHARVRVNGGTFELVDLGSSNGTYVNFRRLDKESTSAINDRDVLFLGRTVVKFYAGDAPAKGGVLNPTELRDLLRGTVPIAALATLKMDGLVEQAQSMALRAERAEIMRRLGMHMMSEDELQGLFEKAKS